MSVSACPADVGRNVILTSGCIIGAFCQVNTCEVIPENTVIYGSGCMRRVQTERPQVSIVFSKCVAVLPGPTYMQIEPKKSALFWRYSAFDVIILTFSHCFLHSPKPFSWTFWWKSCPTTIIWRKQSKQATMQAKKKNHFLKKTLWLVNSFWIIVDKNKWMYLLLRCLICFSSIFYQCCFCQLVFCTSAKSPFSFTCCSVLTNSCQLKNILYASWVTTLPLIKPELVSFDNEINLHFIRNFFCCHSEHTHSFLRLNRLILPFFF